LAAASSLTIPLQITLSEIKLSAFIILVFSKQKGLTIVFRNDPLESLKVSSTFDSIQFVRDYLQRTIEGKLRDLMMDELPAIIHRLSLQLWCPDQIKEEEESKETSEPGVNPLATPPLDAVDLHGHLLDPAAISELSLDGGPEAQLLFSQKTLLKLSDMTNAQVTSSLDTATTKDVLIRAWAGPDRFDATSTPPGATPNLPRTSSSVHTYTFSDSASQDNGSIPSRPSLVHAQSATAGLSLGSGRHTKPGRKKKTRVVDLRRRATDNLPETASEGAEESTDAASTAAGPMSEPAMPHEILDIPDVRFNRPAERRPSFRATSPKPSVPLTPTDPTEVQGARASEKSKSKESLPVPPETSKADWKRGAPMSDTSSVILEQAWIMKMAGEIARRVYEEKQRNNNNHPSFWDERDDTPPPAYDAH
jgi:distribution and morphology protein 34